MNGIKAPVTVLALLMLFAAAPTTADHAAPVPAAETATTASEDSVIRLAWDRVGAVA